MLRNFLFILVLLLFCVSFPLWSQAISMPLKSLQEIQSLNWSTQAQTEYLESELSKAEEKLKQAGISLTLADKELEKLENTIAQLKSDLAELKRIQEESMKSSKASSLRTNFVVGGVCIVVGIGIGVGLTVAILEALKQ